MEDGNLHKPIHVQVQTSLDQGKTCVPHSVHCTCNVISRYIVMVNQKLQYNVGTKLDMVWKITNLDSVVEFYHPEGSCIFNKGNHIHQFLRILRFLQCSLLHVGKLSTDSTTFNQIDYLFIYLCFKVHVVDLLININNKIDNFDPNK